MLFPLHLFFRCKNTEIMSKKMFISTGKLPSELSSNPWLMKVLYISNPYIPFLVFVPIILGLTYYSFAVLQMTISHFLLFFAIAVAYWTLFEYAMHRFAFHFETENKAIKRFVYLLHGAHHDYPNDESLFMVSPLTSVSAAIIHYLFLFFLFGSQIVNPFMIGIMCCYLLYDWLHHAVHSYNFKNKWFQKMKKHHMKHHFHDSKKGFGFTTVSWDKMLKTDFDKK